jgi:hypothetical protein
MTEELHPILTKPEAMALAKKATPRGFDDWRRKFGVRNLGANRYSRRELMLALNREAGFLPMPATLKRKYTRRQTNFPATRGSAGMVQDHGTTAPGGTALPATVVR